jgi:GNAT superfamily N-acetyltransferase
VSIELTLKPVDDFTDEEARLLREMKAAVYPENTPGVEENRAREWESPRWGVLLTDGTGQLVSYTGIVTRDVLVDGEPILIGGIGGVATHPGHRGKGYAPLGMSHALDFLLGMNAQFALLVCRDDLVDYYDGLGWRLFEGTVVNTQFGEPEVFTYNNVMVGDLASAAPREGTIDLLGPPW